MLIMCLSAFTVSAFAQNMPKEGYSGLGFNITGLATVAFGNYGSSILSVLKFRTLQVLLPVDIL